MVAVVVVVAIMDVPGVVTVVMFVAAADDGDVAGTEM